MPLVIPPGFADIAIELRGTGDPEPWYVTFGVDVTGHSGSINSIGGTCNSAWDQLMSVVSNEVLTTGCKVTVGQDGPFPVRGFSTLFAGGAGTNNGAKLPQNCAALVHKDTGVGGRRARGRFYLPAVVGEGETSTVGLISAPMVAQLQSAVDSFFDTLASQTPPCPMVVLHNSDGVSPLIEPTPVLGLRVDTVIATQRRRLR